MQASVLEQLPGQWEEQVQTLRMTMACKLHQKRARRLLPSAQQSQPCKLRAHRHLRE